MQKLLVVLIFTAALGFNACNHADCEDGTPDPNCLCTMDYNPVCGCDVVTYSNACVAECAGITEYTSGTCN